MTKDRLEKMTIKELEMFLNSCIDNITYTSSDASSVKRTMFDRIKEVFSPAFDLNYSSYVHYDFTIPIKNFGVHFKIGTKSTGEIRQITKLRSKNVVGVGKIKLDFIHFSYGMPSFKLKDDKRFLIDVEKGWSTSGGTIRLAKTSTKTFEEMSNPEYILSFIEGQYKLVEENNKRRNETKRVYTSLKEEIGLSAAQPLLKTAIFGNENKLIKKLPKEYQKQIKNGETDWFEATIKIVIENNPRLIEETQRKILEGCY